jgi:uncharacterized RDD family membrane protein YckC
VADDDAHAVEGSKPAPAAPRLATEVVGRRAIQFVLDTALSSLLLWVSIAALDSVDTSGSVDVIPLFLFWQCVVFVITPALARGRTPGMVVMGISVVRSGGGPVSFGQLLVRWLVLLVEGPFLLGLLGLVFILFSRDHTRIGDKIAGTWVVWTPRGQVAWIS